MLKMHNEDLLDTYKTTTSKLRKRFLRKPNVAEASDEFNSLAQHCERNQILEFAGLCWLGVAKCEGSLGNSHTEIESLLKAARIFISSKNVNKHIGCSSVKHEKINACLNCYHHVISRFRENSPLCITAHIEAKHVLNDQLIKDVESDKAKQIHPALILHILSLKFQRLIRSGEYINALDVVTQMDSCIHSSAGIFRDIIIRNEITKVLLLVMLEIPIGQLTVSQAKLIEKYSWVDFIDTKDEVGLPEDLDLFIRSLIAAWQCKDINLINDIRPKMISSLSPTQKKLLMDLVEDQLVTTMI